MSKNKLPIYWITRLKEWENASDLAHQRISIALEELTEAYNELDKLDKELRSDIYGETASFNFKNGKK